MNNEYEEYEEYEYETETQFDCGKENCIDEYESEYEIETTEYYKTCEYDNNSLDNYDLDSDDEKTTKRPIYNFFPIEPKKKSVINYTTVKQRTVTLTKVTRGVISITPESFESEIPSPPPSNQISSPELNTKEAERKRRAQRILEYAQKVKEQLESDKQERIKRAEEEEEREKANLPKDPTPPVIDPAHEFKKREFSGRGQGPNSNKKATSDYVRNKKDRSVTITVSGKGRGLQKRTDQLLIAAKQNGGRNVVVIKEKKKVEPVKEEPKNTRIVLLPPREVLPAKNFNKPYIGIPSENESDDDNLEEFDGESDDDSSNESCDEPDIAPVLICTENVESKYMSPCRPTKTKRIIVESIDIEEKPTEKSKNNLQKSLLLNFFSNDKPQTKNTQPSIFCNAYITGNNCTRVNCTFAHSLEEIAPNTCKFRDNCKIKEDCKFIHPSENISEYATRVYPSFKQPQNEQLVLCQAVEQIDFEILETLRPNLCGVNWCTCDKKHKSETKKSWYIRTMLCKEEELEEEEIKEEEIKEEEIKEEEIKEISTVQVKSQMCKSVLENTNCSHGEKCKFAHCFNQLTPRNCIYGNSCKLKNNKNKTCIYIHPDENKMSFCMRLNIPIHISKHIPNSTPADFQNSSPTPIPISSSILPNKKQTPRYLICKSVTNNLKCTHPSCKFAHSRIELVPKECNFKNCKHFDTCSFFHSQKETLNDYFERLKI